jgi:dihydroorotate dehydrogenase
MDELAHLHRRIRDVVFRYPVTLAAGIVKTAEQVRALAPTDVIPEWGSITTNGSSGNGERDYHAEYADMDGKRVLLYTQNSLGLPNPGMSYVEGHATELIKLYDRHEKPLILNISGNGIQDTLELMRRAKQCGFRLVIVNGACPNKKDQPILCDDHDAVDGVFDGAEKEIGPSETIFIWKISNGMRRPALTHNRDAVSKSRVFDGIMTGNTVPNTLEYRADGSTTIKTGNGLIRGGMGGPAIRPIALDHTAFVAETLTKKVVWGCGGVETADHARKFFGAGSLLVALNSAYREAGEDPDFMTTLLEKLVRR